MVHLAFIYMHLEHLVRLTPNNQFCIYILITYLTHTGESALTCKSELTLLTLVRLHTRVREHVPLEIAFLCKSAITHLTLVRLHTRVREHVRCEMAFLCKSELTLLTLVRLYTRVREHVPCESMLVSTFLSTHTPVTHEALFYTDGCGWFDTLFGRG